MFLVEVIKNISLYLIFKRVKS